MTPLVFISTVRQRSPVGKSCNNNLFIYVYDELKRVFGFVILQGSGRPRRGRGLPREYHFLMALASWTTASRSFVYFLAAQEHNI